MLHGFATLAWPAGFLAIANIPNFTAQSADLASRPNIVVILADDLGYGDVKCLNPDGKIATPHMDQLAAQGMVFTDAHSGSAVCSPTRYGLMTGRYAWRSKLQSGVLGGLSPRLTEPGRMTVASLLKKHGYQTACIGKWHLGMDWVVLPGKNVAELNIESREQVHNVDYAQPIANGPTAVGFDRYFGISASLDMVPYTFIENDHVTKLPTEDRDFPLMLGRAQGRCRLGPAAPGFEVEDVLPTLTGQACDWITSCAADAKKGQPFFLYLPLASPHTPIAPLKEWQGKSGLNYYADFVMHTDAAIGQVLATLDKQGLADSTLVIVTSDNGCSPQADFPALEAKGHDPSYIYRGHKADIFEGGHRVPFIVRWPGRVKSHSQSDETVCLVDVLATCAEIVGEKLPDNAGEDSASLVPLLTQQPAAKTRDAVVHHSINGSFAIRQGDWKLALCPGSGGWSAPRPGRDDASDLPLVQLYNLADDPGEQRNVQAEQPEVVAKLTALLQKYIDEGRSTPGQTQKNAVSIDPWRPAKAAHAALKPNAKSRKKS